MSTILITGANRGIGLELARQYATDGWEVHATAREPLKADDLRGLTGIRIHQLDVADRRAIDHLAAAIRSPLDIVIANAGVFGPKGGPGQTFGQLDYDAWEEVMRTNVFGAVRTLEAFQPHLEKGRERKMVAISSQMGSIEETSQNFIAYRTSKAALNMAMNASAQALSEEGIAVGVLHPGWVKTDMGGDGADLDVVESAKGLRKVISGLTPSETAHFVGYDGRSIPW